jgi:hypothetical protein
MRQAVEQRATRIAEGIGLERSMRPGDYTAHVTAALPTALPEANLRAPLFCGHPRACLYAVYCPPDEPGWRARIDVFCTACRCEATAVAEARSDAFDAAHQECWKSRNSDEIADAILALRLNEEKS